MLIGVLAVQGAFAAHIAALARLGVETREIRQRSHLDGIDAPACEMLIDVETRIMRCHRALMVAGEVVTTPEGLIAAQPLADHLGKLLAQRSRLVQELGLTPAQRRSLALDQAQESAGAALLRAMRTD